MRICVSNSYYGKLASKDLVEIFGKYSTSTVTFTDQAIIVLTQKRRQFKSAIVGIFFRIIWEPLCHVDLLNLKSFKSFQSDLKNVRKVCIYSLSFLSAANPLFQQQFQRRNNASTELEWPCRPHKTLPIKLLNFSTKCIGFSVIGPPGTWIEFWTKGLIYFKESLELPIHMFACLQHLLLMNPSLYHICERCTT